MASQGPTLLALCGALRRGSFNRKLLDLGIEAAERHGARIDNLDLRELALPLYDGDLEAEQGLPVGAQELKKRIEAAQGLLIASPEYNHSIPGTFKNAIDWATRGSNPFQGKTAALMGASTGAFGAVRSLQHLRQVLMARGVWILPAYVTIPNAAAAFDDQGRLKDESLAKQVDALTATLVSRLA
jgi:chromate reductase, NAD(P)H dehydrogenase (quinone)